VEPDVSVWLAYFVHSEAYIIVTLVDGREIDVPGYLKIKRKPLKSC